MKTLTTFVSAIALLLVAGCASSRLAPVATTPSEDLLGTWRGSYGQVEGVLYTDNGDCLLQINRDGTFVQRITPQPGANNLAKPSTWTGNVLQRGNRVTLRSDQGPSWTLVHSGNRMYAIAEDPIVEATIALSYQRVGVRG